MASQLFRVKSIDKLIADADRPEHRLKKTLGPWSLTALGIGAIIGSGIFVLTGTAAAGENLPGAFNPPRASSRHHRKFPAAWRHSRGSDARTPARGAVHRNLIFAGGGRVQLCGAVLCRAGVHDSDCRQRVHILLRHAG